MWTQEHSMAGTYKFRHLTHPKGLYELNNSANEVVKRLTDKFKNSGRNITVDNWYTGYNLTKDVLKEEITLL